MCIVTYEVGHVISSLKCFYSEAGNEKKGTILDIIMFNTDMSKNIIAVEPHRVNADNNIKRFPANGRQL